MKKRQMIFWLVLSVLIVSSVGIAVTCRTGTHTFSGGTEASGQDMCIPDVGSSGPVTSASQQTSTATTTSSQTDSTQTSSTQTSASGDGLQMKFSGQYAWTTQYGTEMYMLYDSWMEDKDQIRQALNACPLPVDLDCNAKCPGSDIKTVVCLDQCDQETWTANMAYNSCLMDDYSYNYSHAYSDVSQMQSYLSDKEGCYSENYNVQEQACTDACPSDPMDYSVRSNCETACWYISRKAQYKSHSCDLHTLSEAKDFFQRWLAVADTMPAPKTPDYGYDQGSASTDQGSASSPTFNTNSDRGRTDQKLNPSISGYLGDAYVTRSDGTKVIPGKELYLNVGDSIVSGQKANVNIMFSNAGSMNLGPNTVVRVGNALLDQYYLDRGSLKSQINWGTEPVHKLEFHTPNAGITVKGTEFIIYYNDTTNTTVVFLNKGVLEINIQDQIINLTAGHYLTIYPDGKYGQYSLTADIWDYMSSDHNETLAVVSAISSETTPVALTPSANRLYKSFVQICFYIDILIVLILILWMNYKIKNQDKKDKSTGKGIASLVLGLLGLLFFAVPYIGLVFSALGICFARIQRSYKPTTIATIGLAISAIAMILNFILLIKAL